MPDPSELFTNFMSTTGLESFGVDRKEVRTALP
uniref:AY112355 n=1 Tax=Arundo donax TaxID=35708 RepID=A0A0A9HEY1_ARUDO